MTASNQSVVSATTPESLALKSTSLSMPVLELRSTDLDDVDQLLLAKVESAPAFFKRCPVVFNFNYLDAEQTVDLKELHAICLRHGFLPMGIQGEYEVYQQDLIDLGLANFAKGKVKSDNATDKAAQPSPAKPIEPVAEPVQQVVQREVVEPEVIEVIQEKLIPTKVVSSPIRSGQQIYAPGDLIILSSVSAGAEVLAVGNIHVYGALRGRALAGVKGDESVSVFCQKQEAELISIAGRFMIDEQLRSANWQSSVQACLKDDELIIKKLGE